MQIENYEPETRTDIEELYNERIAALMQILNERITNTVQELEFEKRQNEILRKEKEFFELENYVDRQRVQAAFKNNKLLRERNSFLESENAKMIEENLQLFQESEKWRKERNNYHYKIYGNYKIKSTKNQ